ncbi:MAG: hypothetical protein ACI9G1_002542 [Pirellulaceae bacterium]|jgi:hypothetical protein
MPTTEMPLDVNQQGDVTVVDLFPSSAAKELGTEFIDNLIQLIAEDAPEKLLLNFDYADWSSTPMISGLLEVKERLASTTEMKMCGINADAEHVCRFLNLNSTVFDIYDTVDDAINSFDRE